MKGQDGIAMTRQVVEEIFLSEQTVFPDPITGVIDMNSKPRNTHKSYWLDGKYYFNHNEMWNTFPGFNKAIGLRDIRILPSAYAFFISLNIKKWTMAGFVPADGDAFVQIRIDLIINVKTTDAIEDALGNIALYANNAIRTEIGKHALQPAYQPLENWPMCITRYVPLEHAAEILWYGINDNPHECFEIQPVVIDTDFFKLFNVPNITVFTQDKYDVLSTIAIPYARWDFANVWDRTSFCLHASFVQYTSDQFLGRSGEFYAKISKIYDYNTNAGSQFWVQISFNGRDCVSLPYENFMLQLACIMNINNFQSK
jgi:hypothetical protein